LRGLEGWKMEVSDRFDIWPLGFVIFIHQKSIIL
jgi:hypothetical protein